MCMKEFTKILSLFVLLFFFLGTSRLAAQQSAQSFDGSDLYAKYYLEHLPDDYNPNDGKRYPVLIALHGFGEGGNQSINSTKFLRSTGIPALIDNGSFPTSFTVNGKVFKFIVISPQLNQKNLSWYTPQVDYVVQQVKSIYANKADFQRIYLTGYSGGGAGVYTYPATATVLGNQIAAAVVCSGAAWYQNYTEISNIVNSSLPIWAFHNDGDPIVSLTSDQGWFYALNAAGINPKMKLTIYPNINQHDSWTRTYDPSQGNPNNIYQWMLQYSRPNIANPGTPAPPVPIASIPTAVAGNSQVITLSAGSTGSAVIDGSSSSDAGGSIISYQWAKLSGSSGDRRPAARWRLERRSEPFFNHVQQPLADLLHLRADHAGERAVHHQHGQTVHRRPGQKLRARPTPRRHHAGGHQLVQRSAKQLERVQPAVAGRRQLGCGLDQLVGRPESGAKKACFFHRETQVAGTHGADAGAGQIGRRQITGYVGQLGLHRAGHGRQGSRSHGLQQGLAARKVTVGRVGRHPRAAGGLTQHHRARPAGAGKLNAGVEQCAAQIAVPVGAARGGHDAVGVEYLGH